MINLPEFDKAFDYENNFYLSCGTQRISKILAHYELFKKTVDLAGEIVEFGVFKGVSLLRWAHFRQMHGGASSKRIIGFDVFDKFPSTDYAQDHAKLGKFIESAGDQSISRDQLTNLLSHHGLDAGVDLIEGDILETVPGFLESRPELKISLLNLDTDIYEPAVVILESMWERVVPGGIVLLDDYAVFPGETKAVDDFFAGKSVQIRKLPFAKTPSYIIK